MSIRHKQRRERARKLADEFGMASHKRAGKREFVPIYDQPAVNKGKTYPYNSTKRGWS